MKLSSWLDEKRGRRKAMACFFGVTKGAVTHWAAHGVPPARMKSVRDYTQGEVTLEEMLPEASPAAGLPVVAPAQVDPVRLEVESLLLGVGRRAEPRGGPAATRETIIRNLERATAEGAAKGR